MNSVSSQPATPFFIDGPCGKLEALLEEPGAAISATVVVCHPHPQYGGTMTNKVVHMLAKACLERGAAAVRFNYRGVGASAGRYDEGKGETDDALAALDWARQRWPSTELWLAGFSFGGAVAVRAAPQRDVTRLITVAPAIQRVNVDMDRLPQCPWLLIQGDADELVDAQQVRQWVASLRHAPELAVLQGVDHFFHGRLNELRDVVVQWLERQH